ncbi:MFS transporter [Azotobacter salinestris]|uniref:MFS transporter n=1 Tax=Azotobacter salinestris TaxID=69964 RepID=UPI001266C3D7|nr:MFS transporter [Azotobacter salinestris]
MTTNEPLDGKLPVGALLALAMTGFICIVTETLPAGLQPEIGTGLGVSASLAGQMVTVYALGSLLAAIPLTIATQNWRRRTVLMLTIIGFLVFNSITAISTNYWVTLVARFFAGVSAGLAWSLIAGYARRMVVPKLQGRALAIAMVGTPIALSLGVPLGTWLGGVMGWRMAFALMSALTLVLIAWVLIKVPDYPGQSSSQRMALRQVFISPGVRPVLGVVMTWMLAHNILYTYIAPFVSQAGLTSDVDLVLLVFGLAALGGIGATGRLVDRYLRSAVLASLAIFTAVSALLGLFPHSAVAVYAGVFLWGLSFGGAATLLQTALADSAGKGADVALSMNVVAWNSAIAGGGLIGGVLLGQWGAAVLPWVLIFLLLASLAIAFRARTHGFPQGERRTGQVVLGH